MTLNIRLIVYELFLLQDPADAIPKGTLGAILTTFVTYMIYPVLIAASTMRDASGMCI